MAVSLRDKLKSMERQGPRPAAERGGAEDCCVRTFSSSAADTELDLCLPGRSLGWVLGGEWPDISREEILFLDTETNGLGGGAGTVAFLAGAGWFEGDAFRVEQYLMRDYDEERFLIARLEGAMAGKRFFCTYNGASFDLPLLRSRFIMCGRRMPELRGHIDLIHPARRVWKTRLENCSLKRLEEEVLHIPRQADLPGAQVPERYRLFLQRRDMGLLEDILDHNRQDILTLPRILAALIRAHERPEALGHGEDVFSVGRVLEKRREFKRAGECYRLAGKSRVRYRACVALGSLSLRLGSAREAAEHYEDALRVRRSADVYIALSKLYEHRLKEYGPAERYALKALDACPGGDEALRGDIMKRIHRIQIKQRRRDHGDHGYVQDPQGGH